MGGSVKRKSFLKIIKYLIAVTLFLGVGTLLANQELHLFNLGKKEKREVEFALQVASVSTLAITFGLSLLFSIKLSKSSSGIRKLKSKDAFLNKVMLMNNMLILICLFSGLVLGLSIWQWVHKKDLWTPWIYRSVFGFGFSFCLMYIYLIISLNNLSKHIKKGFTELSQRNYYPNDSNSSFFEGNYSDDSSHGLYSKSSILYDSDSD